RLCRSSTALSVPSRSSMCDSSNPAGPPPMIATWVRVVTVVVVGWAKSFAVRIAAGHGARDFAHADETELRALAHPTTIGVTAASDHPVGTRVASAAGGRNGTGERAADAVVTGGGIVQAVPRDERAPG